MQFSQIIAVLAFAAVGTNAAIVPKPVVGKPVISQQSITCTGGAAFCCGSMTDNSGTTSTKCEVWQNGVGAVCNQILTCCNNNGGRQTCVNNIGTNQIFFVKQGGVPCDFTCFQQPVSSNPAGTQT